MELPTLTAPQEREPLTLYLSVSDIAVRAVLLTDRKTVQKPILCQQNIGGCQNLIFDAGKVSAVVGVCSTKVEEFADKGLQEWLSELHINQAFTSVAHLQAYGQVERANRSIKDGIKARLGAKRTGLVDELPHVLWAHRTKKKMSNSEILFSLTYGTEAMIPAEIGVPSARMLLIEDNEKELRLNLDLLEERRELAAIRGSKYKHQLQKFYDVQVKICEYNKGDYVFRNNKASNAKLPRKLAPTWEGQ
ncbi:uncharacterized protein LOC143578621 [Bidens hawaiensis]|uniref:uncharacterized protein LOC143578621 n=1 Tax=Bidens hawaiensis TaxID=980011 RepID=UPI0040499EBC